jgi:hypothetical protein
LNHGIADSVKNFASSSAADSAGRVNCGSVATGASKRASE